MKFLLLSLFLGELFLISSGEGVTYCVKPTPTGTCLDHDCQQCETLQYYFDNVDETINQQNNVTLLFMTGSHTVYVNDTVAVRARIVSMTGRVYNVSVTWQRQGDWDMFCPLYTQSFTSVNVGITNITISNFRFLFLADGVFLIGSTFLNSNIVIYHPSTTLIENCIFEDHTHLTIQITSNAMLKACEFRNASVFGIEETKMTIVDDIRVQRESFFSAINSTVVFRDSKFCGRTHSSILYSQSSNITFSGQVSFTNNTAFNGGAISLYSSSSLNVLADANVTFINNSALDSGGAVYLYLSVFYIVAGANLTFVGNSASNRGGAIFVFPGETASVILSQRHIIFRKCFYRVLNCNNFGTIYIYFSNNSAANGGGDDVYGAALENSCFNGCILDLTVGGVSSNTSSVSSDPLRVCVCDSHGVPQCKNMEYIYLSREVHPGEHFATPVAVVGLDFGTTTGVVYSNFLHGGHIKLDSNSDHGLVIKDYKRCSSLGYSLLSNHTPARDTIYITAVYMDAQTAIDFGPFSPHFAQGLTPVFLNVTLLPCPSGFQLLNQRCDCYLHHVLVDDCSIVNGTGYFSWSSNAWITTYEGVRYNKYCPFDYCNTTAHKWINLESESDSQCAFNRAGRLCGGCKENYSLAIGSSHCIHCPNNNNLALLIFFAAAGLLLVLFISALNLTVTQGTINGLIFYANIVWTYQSIFFPQHQKLNGVLIFLKVFIAWINLDFGIETCFASGLTAFWKTWLQFIFPLYIWAIAWLIIVAARYSTSVTKLFGDRAVPVLDTLFLLSYLKLLRIVTTALEFSMVIEYAQDQQSSSTVVWSVDGRLNYLGYPHSTLFAAALITLLLWLPYTLLLFLMQWLRRVSHLKVLSALVVRFHPVYDAYFAPLKNKHQYWFGVLLFARGILLVTFASSFSIPQSINLLLLLVLGVVLLYSMSLIRPYKSWAILLLQSSYLVNIILLSGSVIFTLTQFDNTRQNSQAIAVGLSTGIAFLQFCVIVLHAMIMMIYNRCQRTGHCKHISGIDSDRRLPLLASAD